MIRRAAAILVAAVMLNANVARADVACATHAGRDVAAHGHARDAEPGHRHHTTQREPRDQPCETPSQADCCQALVSCSLGIACGENEQTLTAPPIHRAFDVGIVRMPASPIIPPEPPPPKA